MLFGLVLAGYTLIFMTVDWMSETFSSSFTDDMLHRLSLVMSDHNGELSVTEKEENKRRGSPDASPG